MELKVHVVSVQVSETAKRWVLGLGTPLIVLGAASFAFAGPTPKTWHDEDVLTAEDLNASFQAVAIPAGTISAFAGPIDGNPGTMIDGKPPTRLPPSGWLLCNGDSLNGLSPTYAALYATIGTAYGGTSSSQSFNLPDLRGQFLRGVDGAASRDPDAAGRAALKPGGNPGNAIGSAQGSVLASHLHSITDPGHSHQFYAVGDGCNGSNALARQYTSSCVYGYGTSHNSTGITRTEAFGGAETRPTNVYVNYIIKY